MTYCEKCGRISFGYPLCVFCYKDENPETYNANRLLNGEYPRIKMNRHRNHNGYVEEHIVFMETILGVEKLPEDWVVHHLNKKKKDNDLNNLCLMTTSAHYKLHHNERIIQVEKTDDFPF